MMTEQHTTMLNGWNVADIEEAVGQIEEQPEAGLLRWKSRAIWDQGFALDVRTESIEQLGEEMPRKFTLRGDHPPELLGHNTGPTAIETALAALGACVAGTFAAKATGMGVTLEGLEVELAGTIDLNGLFGIRPVDSGLSGVELRLHARSEADQSVLEEILEQTRDASPVFDTFTRPIEVRASVERAG